MLAYPSRSSTSIMCVFHLVTTSLYRPTMGKRNIWPDKCDSRDFYTLSRMSAQNRQLYKTMAVDVPKLKLNNGFEIPVLGLGTWKASPGEVKQAVKDAIDVGYRHVDCAFNYQNEAEIGAAIKEKIDEGVVERKDLFIVSKLWNTFHRPDLVEVGLKTSLTDLGLDYLDLYLIHWPTAFKEETGERYPRDERGNVIYSDVDFTDTWEEMEKLVEKGLVRSIGVSNFNHEQIERLLKRAKIRPVTNQIEVHPYLSNPKIVAFCAENDIVVTGYSPLRSPDRIWKHEPTLLEDPTLKELSVKYQRSVPQVILRWLFQRGIVSIPKSVHKNRLQENLNIFNFNLTEDDVKIIFGLNRNRRSNPYIEQAGSHKEYPFKLDY